MTSVVEKAKNAVTDATSTVVETVKGFANASTWDKRSIQDLTGWTILVMGASDGVGWDAAKAFAEHNAHVIVHGRNEEKTAKAAEEIKKTAGPKAKVEYMLAELTDFKSIRAFAEEYKKRGYPLHVLLNNAAIQAPTGKRGNKTEEGFEITMGVNYFSLVYNTLLLLPILKSSHPSAPTSRIVFVTSLGSQLVNPPIIGASEPEGMGIDLIPWDDLKCEKRDDSDWWQYARSKLMNIMIAKAFAEHLRGTGIKSYVAHPGLSVTDHFGKADTDNKLSSRLVAGYANSPIGQTSEHGAIALEYACTDPGLEEKTGAYVGSSETGALNIFQAKEKWPNAPMANNPEACERLYKETIKIIADVTGEDWVSKAP
jgi:NAD(P)-dependent dehydrogenase (short-subunit alcohol dehydrogenase family)